MMDGLVAKEMEWFLNTLRGKFNVEMTDDVAIEATTIE